MTFETITIEGALARAEADVEAAGGSANALARELKRARGRHVRGRA